MKPALLSAVLLAAACSRPAGEPGTAAYSDFASSFALRGPDSWRVLENQGGAHRVSFFGPASGKRPYSAMIAVYLYPEDGGGFKTPEAYAAAKSLGSALPAIPREIALDGRKAYEVLVDRTSPGIHGRPPEAVRERSVLIPSSKGLYALVHSAPAESAKDTAEVFEKVLFSFRPAGG